jgi:hypothetical protein
VLLYSALRACSTGEGGGGWGGGGLNVTFNYCLSALATIGLLHVPNTDRVGTNSLALLSRSQGGGPGPGSGKTKSLALIGHKGCGHGHAIQKVSDAGVKVLCKLAR